MRQSALPPVLLWLRVAMLAIGCQLAPQVGSSIDARGVGYVSYIFKTGWLSYLECGKNRIINCMLERTGLGSNGRLKWANGANVRIKKATLRFLSGPMPRVTKAVCISKRKTGRRSTIQRMWSCCLSTRIRIHSVIRMLRFMIEFEKWTRNWGVWWRCWKRMASWTIRSFSISVIMAVACPARKVIRVKQACRYLSWYISRRNGATAYRCR